MAQTLRGIDSSYRLNTMESCTIDNAYYKDTQFVQTIHRYNYHTTREHVRRSYHGCNDGNDYHGMPPVMLHEVGCQYTQFGKEEGQYGYLEHQAHKKCKRYER